MLVPYTWLLFNQRKKTLQKMSSFAEKPWVYIKRSTIFQFHPIKMKICDYTPLGLNLNNKGFGVYLLGTYFYLYSKKIIIILKFIITNNDME